MDIKIDSFDYIRQQGFCENISFMGLGNIVRYIDLHSQKDIPIERQIAVQIDRQTDRKKESQTDKKKNEQIKRQITLFSF